METNKTKEIKETEEVEEVTAETEKTFTQEEVNKIIDDILSKEKRKQVNGVNCRCFVEISFK